MSDPTQTLGACRRRPSSDFLDAGAVTQRCFIHGVAAPLRAGGEVAGAYREHQALPIPGPDDHMLGLGRAVHEVPLTKRALLPLDDQERLPGEHEEVLLIRLPVVHSHRLAGRESNEVDPQLRKLRVTLEAAVRASPFAGPPTRLASIENEPALARGDEAVFGRFER